GADTGHVRGLDHIGVEGEVDPGAAARQSPALLLEYRPEPSADLGAPADRAAALPGIPLVVAADGVRLGAEADGPLAGQRALGVLQGLAEGRAAVPEAAEARSQVQVGIQVEDRHRAPGPDVPSVVPQGSLMPAPEHHRHGAAPED